jgi:hypothetical protein
MYMFIAKYFPQITAVAVFNKFGRDFIFVQFKILKFLSF